MLKFLFTHIYDRFFNKSQKKNHDLSWEIILMNYKKELDEKYFKKNTFLNAHKKGFFKRYCYMWSLSDFSKYYSQRVNHRESRINNWRYFFKQRRFLRRLWWRLTTFYFWNNKPGAKWNHIFLWSSLRYQTDLNLISKPLRFRYRKPFIRFKKLSSPWNFYVKTRSRYPHDQRAVYNWPWKFKTQKYGIKYRKTNFFRDLTSSLKWLVWERITYYGRIKFERELNGYALSFFTEWMYKHHFKKKRRSTIFRWTKRLFKYFTLSVLFMNVLGYVTELWSEYMINRRTSKTRLIFSDKITLYDINRFFFRIDYYMKRSSQLFLFFYGVAHFVRVCGGKPIFKNPTNNFIDVLQTIVSFIWIKVRRKFRSSFIDIRDDIPEWYKDVDIHYILIPIALYWYIFYLYLLIIILNTESYREANMFNREAIIGFQEIFLFHTNHAYMSWEDIDEYDITFYPFSWTTEYKTFEYFYNSERYLWKRSFGKNKLRRFLRYFTTTIYSQWLWLNWRHTWYQNYYVLYFPNLNPTIRNLQLFHWEFIFVPLMAVILYSDSNHTKFHFLRSIYKTIPGAGDNQCLWDEIVPDFKEESRSIAEYVYDFFDDLVFEPVYAFIYDLVTRFDFWVHMKKVKRVFFRSSLHKHFFKRKWKTFTQIRVTVLIFLNRYIMSNKSLLQKELRVISFNKSIIKRRNKVDWIVFTRDGEDIEDDLLWWNCNTLDWDDERSEVLR